MRQKRPKPVYSTNPDTSTRCRKCGSDPCRCSRNVKSLPPAQQVAYIRRERKGRRGKTVTVVSNLHLSAGDMKALGRHLKQACGSGGTVKDGAIEIQGDHRDKIADELEALGYKVRFSGG
ncbi:MAG: translation initiation factor [Anaerolineae bacterium]